MCRLAVDDGLFELRLATNGGFAFHHHHLQPVARSNARCSEPRGARTHHQQIAGDMLLLRWAVGRTVSSFRAWS